MRTSTPRVLPFPRFIATCFVMLVTMPTFAPARAQADRLPAPATSLPAARASAEGEVITTLPTYQSTGATWPYQDMTLDRVRYGTPQSPLAPVVDKDAFFTPFMRESYLGNEHRGGLQGGFFLGQVRGAPAAGQGNWNYTALQTLMSVTANLGGTAATMTAGRGQVFGFSPLAVLYPGATNLLNLTGGEINVQVSRGASVAYKSGLQIVGMMDDAVQGSVYDAGLSISGQGGAVGFRHGILFSAANGKSGVADGGTILGVMDAPVLANGVDLSGASFSGKAFASNDFSVDGTGNVRGRSISVATQQLAETTYAALPRCDKVRAGTLAYIADAAVPIKQWHQPVTAGGGTHRTFVACLGSGWIAF